MWEGVVGRSSVLVSVPRVTSAPLFRAIGEESTARDLVGCSFGSTIVYSEHEWFRWLGVAGWLLRRGETRVRAAIAVEEEAPKTQDETTGAMKEEATPLWHFYAS